MPEASISVTVTSNLSSAFRGMQASADPLRTSIRGLKKDMDALGRTKLNLNMSPAREELQATQKAFQRTRNAAVDFQETKLDTGNMVKQLTVLNTSAEQVTQSLNRASVPFLKTPPSQNGAGNAGRFGTVKNVLSSSGMLQMVQDTGLQLAGTYLQSALGDAGGTVASSALSGAANGAAIGLTFGVPGALIGAAAGGLLGAAQGQAKVYEREDAAFKSYVQEQTEARLQERQALIQAGSPIAAQREQNRLQFSTLLGGEENASAYLSSLEDEAAHTPFSYDELAGLSKTLLSFGYTADEMIPAMESIGEAGTAMGLSYEGMQSVAGALGQLRKGAATPDALEALRASGIDGMQMLADAKGVSREAMAQMVSEGTISGTFAAQTIQAGMQQTYGGAMEKHNQTYAGISGNLEDMEANQQAAAGEGYNAVKAIGDQRQADWYGGENGQKMEDVNRALGAWQASLENSKEGFIRGAMDVAMASEEFAAAQQMANDETLSAEQRQQAWSKMGEILAAAKTQGINQYNASEGAQQALESDIALAGMIREDTASNKAYWDAGYRKGESYSQGWQKGMADRALAVAYGADKATNYYLFGTDPAAPQVSDSGSSIGGGNGASGGGRAFGLRRVPYDDYPALLHYGERVLTANEARQLDGGGAGGVTVQVSGLTVREEADVDKIASLLARKITSARAAAIPS